MRNQSSMQIKINALKYRDKFDNTLHVFKAHVPGSGSLLFHVVRKASLLDLGPSSVLKCKTQ